MRAIGWISGVTLAVVLGGACGGTAWKDAAVTNPGPADASVLVTAAQQTAAEHSAHVVLDASVSGMGQSATAHVEGDVDLDSRNADLHLTTTGAGSTGASALELRVVDGVLYVKLPEAMRSQAGTTKPWVEVDAGRLGGALPFGNVTSPQDILSTLKSLPGGVTNVGKEQRGGVATTHYHATIDVTALIKQQGGSAAQAALGMLSTLGGDQLSFPIDVWIDSAGHVRELDIRANAKIVDVTIRLQLSAFGTSVRVQAPPADQVGSLSGNLPGVTP